ncbi:MAG: DUF6935 domain-containing protein [Acutalibacteraceae bacterium]|jgi:hypothetical protein
MSYQSNESRQIVFPALPKSLSEIKALPEASLQEPFFTAALLIPAFCLWPNNKDEAMEILNFLKGPQPLSNYDIQFISERLRGNEYVPMSYFNGATPENNYTPSEPLTVTVSTTPLSFYESGYARLFLRSGGADSPRPVLIRQKPSTGEWFMVEQLLLAQIRKPVAEDPWA